jgi:putative addiction module component (TIGR02574 family)
MLQADVIEKMSVSERLQTMEQLWDALAREESKVPSPEWHGAVLADRKARVERGEAKFYTLDQLRDYLRQQKP